MVLGGVCERGPGGVWEYPSRRGVAAVLIGEVHEVI